MALAPGTGAEPAAESTLFGFSAPCETAMAVLLRSHPSRVDYCLESSSIFQAKGFVTTLIEQNVDKVRSGLHNRPKRLFASEGPNFHY